MALGTRDLGRLLITVAEFAALGCGERSSSIAANVPAVATSAPVVQAPVVDAAAPREAGAGAAEVDAGVAKAPTVLASGPLWNLPHAVTFDAAHVYWLVGGDTDDPEGLVMRVAKTGGEPEVVAQGIVLPRDLAVDATDAYFTSAGPWQSVTAVGPRGSVHAVPLAGGPTRTLASKQWGPTALVLSDTQVFWANPGVLEGRTSTVSGAPKRGGAPSTVASGVRNPYAIAVNDASVYWVEGGTCTSVNGKPVPADGRIRRASLDGKGAPVTLVTEVACPETLAIDGTRVYWASMEMGTVESVPKTGGARTVIATDQKGSRYVALAGDAIYWLNYHDGTIMMAPKAGGVARLVYRGKHPDSMAVDADRVYVTDDEKVLAVDRNTFLMVY
jgi:hypothetical protein